jgi:hypothetical protein
MVVVISVMVLMLCLCLGFAGLYGWAMGQGMSESTQKIGPWFEALKRGDYETAAQLTGPDVKAEQLRDAIESHVGGPLVSYRMIPGSIRFRMDLSDSPPAECATYEFVGTRTKTRVPMEIYEGGGRQYTIRIPSWGIMPETGRGLGGMWGNGTESAESASPYARHLSPEAPPAAAPARPSSAPHRPPPGNTPR